MGYQRPVDAPISASWQDHLDRDPPSAEPGTDYACSYGTPVAFAESGVVIEVKHSNSGGQGRVVGYRPDTGQDTRSLHMSECWASIGQRVSRGELAGLSGASGYGSDWYYGPHVHQTLWPGFMWAAPTIDFELYVGSTPGPTPGPDPTEEDPMRHLIQIDPNSDGRWFLIDYGAGTAQRLYNGLQLDLVRQDRNVIQVGGPQPPAAIDGLTITGEG